MVLTEVEYDGIVGYGEGSMPPYLGESHETATAFLAKVDLGRFANPFELESILGAIDGLAPGDNDQRHRIADMAHAALRQHRPRRDREHPCGTTGRSRRLPPRTV